MKSVNNTKDLWKNINEITQFKCKKTTYTNLLNIGSTSIESVNIVNNFFVKIGSALAEAILSKNHTSNISPNSGHISSFVLLDTDILEVEYVLSNLKTDSVPGWYNIPMRFLKLAKPIIVPIITHLANLCFTSGIFPRPLKQSIVTPVYKGGDDDEVNNYRPISG